MQHRSFRQVGTSFYQRSSNFQNCSNRSQRYWPVEEAVCRRKGLDVSSEQSANFKLQKTKLSAYYSSAVILSIVWTILYKNKSLCWVHSEKVFQQVCTINCRCATTKWREPKFQCRRRDKKKLLANSSYGYQILHHSRHTVATYLNDEKMHCAINRKFVKTLDHVENQLYEVELAKAEVEHKLPNIVRFFILPVAKLRKLDFNYKFFFISSVIPTNLRSWKWIQLLSTLLLLKKN